MTDLSRAMVVLSCAVGDQLGLFAALADGQGRSADDIAKQAGADARYVREWARTLAAARLSGAGPLRRGVPPPARVRGAPGRPRLSLLRRRDRPPGPSSGRDGRAGGGLLPQRRGTDAGRLSADDVPGHLADERQVARSDAARPVAAARPRPGGEADG
ncbi:hypothetical protein ACFSTC_20745 [Nonomuraea ferruginea]